MKDKIVCDVVNHSNRRKALSTALMGASLLASGHWQRPVISSVILPAHAQTSACGGGFSGVITGLCGDGIVLTVEVSSGQASATFPAKGTFWTGGGPIGADGSFSFLIFEEGNPDPGFTRLLVSGLVAADCGQITGTLEDDDSNAAGFCSGSSNFVATPS